MKWIAFAIGLLAFLGLAIAFLGSLLPREHSATRKARFKQEPGVVWALLADPLRAASWRADVMSVEPLPDQNGLTTWREKWKDGKLVVMERTLFEPERKLQTRIANTDPPFGGTWTFELSLRGEGSELRITEDGFVSNTLFRFLARFVFGYTSSMESFLRQLGAKFGEQTVVEE